MRTRFELIVMLAIVVVILFMENIHTQSSIQKLEKMVYLPPNCHYQYDPRLIAGSNPANEELYILYVACAKDSISNQNER